MKKLILIVLMFATLGAYAQTQPSLPMGSVVYGNTYYLDPDGNVWAGSAAKKYRIVAQKGYVDSINALGWSNAQVDSAISSKVAGYVPLTQKGAADGVATLDGSTKIPISQIPDALVGSVNYQGNYNASTNTPTLPSSPSSGTKGHYYVVATGGTQFGETFVAGDWIISNGSEWQKVDNNNAVTSVAGKVGAVTLNVSDVNGALAAGDNVSLLTNDAGYITSADIPAPPVTSVNSKTGAVVINASDVGLGNVDNTSDADKPISIAAQTALNGKEASFSKNTAFNKNFGTTAGTVAQGNHTHTFASLTSKPTTLGGYGITNAYTKTESDSRYTLQQVTNTDAKTSNDIFVTGMSRPNGAPSGAGGYISYRGSTLGFTIGSYDWGTSTPSIMRLNPDGGEVKVGEKLSSPTLEATTTIIAPTATRSASGLVPASGGSGTTRFLREDMSWAVPSGGGGGGTATDLSLGARTGSTMVIGSSTGAGVTLPAATSSYAGLFTNTEKNKLAGIDLSEYLPLYGGDLTGGLSVGAGHLSVTPTTSPTMSANKIQAGWTSSGSYLQGNNGTNNTSWVLRNYIASGGIQLTLNEGGIATASDGTSANWKAAYDWGNHAGLYAPISHVGSGGSAHSNATTSTSGFMSASDKVKLNGLNSSLYVKKGGDTMTGTLVGLPTTFDSAPAYSVYITKHASMDGSYFGGRDGNGDESFWLSPVGIGGMQLNLSKGGVQTASNGTSANWYQAYQWGNHASAGYAKTLQNATASGAQSSNDIFITGNARPNGVPSGAGGYMSYRGSTGGFTIGAYDWGTSTELPVRISPDGGATSVGGSLTVGGTVTAPTIAGNLAFSYLTGKPTTISGYGITDAVTTSRTVTAGNGLTGGGSLAENRTITLGSPTSVTLNSGNTVGSTTHTHAFSPGGTSAQYIRGDGTLATYVNTTYSAGNGLDLNGTSFSVEFGTYGGSAAAGNDSRIVNAVPNSRTVNGKALTSNITLSASDVGAVPISGNATVTGSKTFSSPVTGADGTANNHFVTKQQIPALASQGTGAIRLIEAAQSQLFTTTTSNYLRIGTTSNTYSFTIPAGTFAGNKGMFKIAVLGNYTVTGTSAQQYLQLELTQGSSTYTTNIIGSTDVTPYEESFKLELTGTSRGSGGLFYLSKVQHSGKTARGYEYPYFQNVTESISSIDFREAVTVRLKVSNPSYMDVDVLPLTIEVADLN